MMKDHFMDLIGSCRVFIDKYILTSMIPPKESHAYLGGRHHDTFQVYKIPCRDLTSPTFGKCNHQDSLLWKELSISYASVWNYSGILPPKMAEHFNIGKVGESGFKFTQLKHVFFLCCFSPWTVLKTHPVSAYEALQLAQQALFGRLSGGVNACVVRKGYKTWGSKKDPKEQLWTQKKDSDFDDWWKDPNWSEARVSLY